MSRTVSPTENHIIEEIKRSQLKKFHEKIFGDGGKLNFEEKDNPNTGFLKAILQCSKHNYQNDLMMLNEFNKLSLVIFM